MGSVTVCSSSAVSGPMACTDSRPMGVRIAPQAVQWRALFLGPMGELLRTNGRAGWRTFASTHDQ